VLLLKPHEAVAEAGEIVGGKETAAPDTFSTGSAVVQTGQLTNGPRWF
jgi:hypothetical protein